MRAMSATLEAAVKSLDREASLLARVTDQQCERPRFDWVECYTGAEGDQANAAAVALDGSVLRLRASMGSSATYYYQRVTNVTSAAQWSAWTQVGSGGGTPRVDIACDSVNPICYRLDLWGSGANRDYVFVARSADNGQTWSNWAQVYQAPGGGAVVGASLWCDNGSAYCCVAVDSVGVGSDNYLVMFCWNGTTWTNVGQTAASFGPIDGIGMSRNSYGYLSIFGARTGDASNQSKVWMQDFQTSNNTWGAQVLVVASGAGAAVTFAEPRYWYCGDIGGSGVGRAVLSYVERSSAPVEQRAMICFSPVRWWLTEEVPWKFETGFGVEVLRTASWWIVVGSDRAYRSARYAGASGQALDLGVERIVEIESEQRLDQPGRLRLVVDNSGGWYDEAGVAGDATCLRPGAQIGLRIGYRTSAGEEGIWQAPWWIERVGFSTAGGTGRLTIEARDVRGELRSLRARRLYEWSDVTLGDVVQRCWWRVCGRAESSPHGNLTRTVARFVVNAGENWDEAIERLCRQSGVLQRWSNTAADGVGWDAASPEIVDLGSGASVWSFGGAGQPIAQAACWREARPTQRVEVFGSGCWAAYRDWGEVWAQWRDTGRRQVDYKLDTSTEVADRASWEWRRDGIVGDGGRLRVGIVPGLEVGDVVTVDEPRAGLDGARRTVVGIRTLFRRGAGAVAEQEIELGGTVG